MTHQTVNAEEETGMDTAEEKPFEKQKMSLQKDPEAISVSRAGETTETEKTEETENNKRRSAKEKRRVKNYFQAKS